jgi:hypothetical protein
MVPLRKRNRGLRVSAVRAHVLGDFTLKTFVLTAVLLLASFGTTRADDLGCVSTTFNLLLSFHS